MLDMHLLPLEIDNHAGMTRYKLDVRFRHPTGFFYYEADNIWFADEAVSTCFQQMHQLLAKKTDEARLADPGCLVALTFKPSGTMSFEVAVKLHEPDTGGGTGTLLIATVVDRDWIERWLSGIEERVERFRS